MRFFTLVEEVTFCAILLCAARGAGQQKMLAHEKAPTEYCKVVGDFAKYDHKVLRIRGVFRSGGEIMSFYDPACPTADLTSWVDYGSEFKRRSSPATILTMEKLISEDGRAQIDVLAEFDGPKPVSIPAGTPAEVADAMRGTNSRWGHANQFRFRIRFVKALAVSPVPKTVAWPQ
jgi:hypothetical protein